MTVALALLQPVDLKSLVAWAGRIASAYGEDLLIFDCTVGSSDEESDWVDPSGEVTSAVSQLVAELTEAGFNWAHELGLKPDSDSVSDAADVERRVAILEIRSRRSAKVILEKVSLLQVTRLIIPRQQSDRSTSAEFDTQRQLFRDAPCMTVQLRPAVGQEEVQLGSSPQLGSLLVAAGGGPHTTAALQLAQRLADDAGARLTAMYVAPDVDDVAQQVAQGHLDRIVLRAVKKDAETVLHRVVLSSNPREAIMEEAAQGHELLLMGATHHGVVHRLLFSSLSERLLGSLDGLAVAVVRPPITLRSRFLRQLEFSLQARVPQLDREARVRLVERVQSSSRWDFDFMALICLSTFIAALGLIQDSAAVVIGAMLIAPLMTPLLGAGLSLVQGNSLLLRHAAIAVARGFLLAVFIGLVCGWLLPNSGATNEIAARGSPGIADLLVAFVSGIAAAYAIGRPNLISALPGVAIAAALVPPVATVGLAAAMGDWEIALGALLLFLTNIVAIILGAACALFATGVRGSHDHGRFAGWVPRVAIALTAIAAGLGVYESLPKHHLASQLRLGLAERVDREEHLEFVSAVVELRGERRRIRITVAGAEEPDQKLLHDLMRLVRQHGDMADELRIETQSVVVGNWDHLDGPSVRPFSN